MKTADGIILTENTKCFCFGFNDNRKRLIVAPSLSGVFLPYDCGLFWSCVRKENWG